MPFEGIALIPVLRIQPYYEQGFRKQDRHLQGALFGRHVVCYTYREGYPRSIFRRANLPRRPAVAAGLVRRLPDYFDRLICFPGWPGLPEQPVRPRQIVSFVADMQLEAFDLIFQLQGNGALANAMGVLCDGRKVVGLRKAGEYAPDPALFPVSEDGEHEVLRFLKVCDCLGIPRQGTHVEFRVLEKEKIHCSRIIERAGLANRRYVCVNPGARDPKRRWPAEKFGWLANAVAHYGYTPVLTGSGEEKALLDEVAKRVGIPVVNIVERFGQL